MSLPKFFIVLILTIAAATALSPDAYAYLDPGSGSYLFQLLLSGLLAGMFMFKSFWKNLFRKKKDSREKEKDESENQ